MPTEVRLGIAVRRMSPGCKASADTKASSPLGAMEKCWNRSSGAADAACASSGADAGPGVSWVAQPCKQAISNAIEVQVFMRRLQRVDPMASSMGEPAFQAGYA